MQIRDWLVKWFGEAFKKVATKINVPVVPVDKPVDKPADPAVVVPAGKPMATPLVPFLGKTDAEVDARLHRDWESGIENGCGGLPGDIRPLGIRPIGKTFGWKDVIISGAVKVRLNGNRVTITSGVYKGQLWDIYGLSDHEMPANGQPATLKDWVPATSGVEGPKKHFAYFKCYDV